MGSHQKHLDVDSASREAKHHESRNRHYDRRYTGRDRSRTPTRRNRSRSPRGKRSASSSSSKPSPTPSLSISEISSEQKDNEKVSSSFKAKDVAVPEDYVLLEESRERCKLKTPELVKYKGFAKGTVTEPKERDKWINTLPVIDDISATPPYLQKVLRQGDMKYMMTEGQAIDMHSSLFAALNLLTISDAEGVQQEDRVNFRARSMRVISMLIQQLTTIRRAMAIDALKINKANIGAFGGRALDLKEADNPSREGQKVHWLFSKDMEDELLAEIKKKEKEAEKKKLVSFLYPLRQMNINTDPYALQLPPCLHEPVWKELSAPMSAGRLRYFAHNWSLITNDTFVLEAIKGYKLPFREGREPKTAARILLPRCLRP
uniref:Uncharacterized protein n=1 Tax=Panagrolaimus davidi TaxID=227884 RepID=A0A914PJE4_9BILA